MLTQQDYTSTYKPTWCPGCGNFGIHPATKKALAELNLPPHRVAMTFGIGCSSNGANFFKLYAFHSIHGRSLPVAVGIKLSNHDLTVIADAGDGDAYGEGVGHFVHTARGNIDITYLVHDNRLYSLTKGQMSPTSMKGMKTMSTPFGSLNEPFNPLAAAIINGATFVAQGFSGDINHLSGLIKQAIMHKGFALINILQVCTTFNKVNTFQWYKERIYKLEDAGHDAANYGKALAAAIKNHDKIPIGVLYQTSRPSYHQQLDQLREKPLVKQSAEEIDVNKSFDSYR
ncbi:2-oxoacid:ferredoxin oxidoreductase subunit beta [Patescibacteria group bacterium]|nr:2-oxoacid:ferredoxin oxidoreductase subunit beta [Patescibacteria group bacterium]